MKSTVAILAFTLLYLSVQSPMFESAISKEQTTESTNDACPLSKKSCSSQSSCPSEKKDIPNPCSQCVCNPLAPCCYYLPEEKNMLQINGYVLRKQYIIPFDENILSSYICDFWNPPEPSLVVL